MSDAEKDPRRIGRDEMNLCEFPITLLTERVPSGCKTIAFEDRHGRLIVSGSDAYGLPTAIDSDVIVGLIQLTKLQNDFTDPAVRFSRYELLKLLGWEDRGWGYRRLNESLKRWAGVTLYYDGCWWDNRRKRWVSADFHILEWVILPDKNDPTIESSFAWNRIFFESCRDGNLKRLDLETYFALNSAVSKQLYRFLDKRFYHRPEWTFDLRELAHERVGLSRNYAPRKVKEKLQPALEELEGVGFLEPMANADRYANVSRGEWKIRLVRKLPAPVETQPETEREPTGLEAELIKRDQPETEREPTGLEAELIKRDVSPRQAAVLVRDFPEERIRRQIEQVDWGLRKSPKRIADPGAYLADAIRHDYAAPKGFESAAQRAEREAAARERDEQAEQGRQARARAREEKARIAAYWHGLTPEEQARLESEALAQADPEVRARCATGPLPVRRLTRAAVREAHLRRLLDLPPTS